MSNTGDDMAIIKCPICGANSSLWIRYGKLTSICLKCDRILFMIKFFEGDMIWVKGIPKLSEVWYWCRSSVVLSPIGVIIMV